MRINIICCDNTFVFEVSMFGKENIKVSVSLMDTKYYLCYLVLYVTHNLTFLTWTHMEHPKSCDTKDTFIGQKLPDGIHAE